VLGDRAASIEIPTSSTVPRLKQGFADLFSASLVFRERNQRRRGCS